jgi:hypothetical protein
MTAKEVDLAIKFRVDTVVGGIDDRIVRLMIHNVTRAVVRDLDHAALREYKRRALHFQLDPRKPEQSSRRIGEASPGRRATLAEIVMEHLSTRVLPAGLEREMFVTTGMDYLRRAEESATAVQPVSN